MSNKITLETDDGRKFEIGIQIGVDELGAEKISLVPIEKKEKCKVGYEVKFLVNPDLVLDSSTKQPNAEFLALFTGMALKGTTKMSYYDTPDLALNQQNWTIRIRKKEKINE